MERIDVLKGIEKILVEKAYEIGHVSHRRDGDWQKTNSGWVKVKQNSTPKAGGSGGGGGGNEDETPDDYIDWDSINNDTMLEHAYDMMPRNVQDKYDINDVLKMWQEKRGLDSDTTEIEEEEEETTTTNNQLSSEDVQHQINRWSKIDPRGTGWIIKNPTPERLDKQAEQMTGAFMEYFSQEHGAKADRADLKNRILQKMNELNGVQKSAVRDMRFQPAVKNMGF